MLVYMADDNNLESAGVSDLEKMQKVGSDDNINVIVRFDTDVIKQHATVLKKESSMLFKK